MKIRQGFVSNSSSSSFVVILNDSNRHLAHYNYRVTDEEYIYEESNLNDIEPVWLDNYEIDMTKTKRDVLAGQGYTYFGESDYGGLIYICEHNIYNTLETGLGRSTSICFGEDLQKYTKQLQEETDYPNDLGWLLQDLIDQYGTDNLLFMRDSDESMGGRLPTQLQALTKDAVLEMEYH